MSVFVNRHEDGRVSLAGVGRVSLAGARLAGVGRVSLAGVLVDLEQRTGISLIGDLAASCRGPGGPGWLGLLGDSQELVDWVGRGNSWELE